MIIAKERPGKARDWTRPAHALDLYLSGVRIVDIAKMLGVTEQHASVMVRQAKAMLAFRLFKGLERPSFQRRKWFNQEEETQKCLIKQPMAAPSRLMR